MKTVTAMLVALAATLATPAHSAATVSGSLGSFSVQLFDLAPNDGIAPSISWLASPGTSNIGGTVDFTLDPSLHREYARTSILQFLVLNDGDVSPAATLNSTISNVNGNPPSGLALNVSNQTYGVPAGLGGYVQTTAFANTSATFNLSANTVAVFFAAASGAAASSMGGIGGNEESVSGTVYLRVFGPGSTSDEGFQSVEDSLAFASHLAALPSNRSRILSGTFTNASNAIKAGFVGAEISMGALSNVSAVPEPENYALFLLGLGLIGTMVRRRL